MNTARQYQEALHKLEAVSFTREQGETILTIVEERQQAMLAELATKQDIKDLRHEIAEVRTELKHEIAMAQLNLTNKIDKTTFKFTLALIAVGLSPHVSKIWGFIQSLT